MNEEKQIAIQNLEKYIKVDSIYNGSRENLSDFDEFCINHCLDIQIVLELVKEQQNKIKSKEGIIEAQAEHISYLEEHIKELGGEV